MSRHHVLALLMAIVPALIGPSVAAQEATPTSGAVALGGAITNMRTNLTSVKDADVRMRYEDLIAGWEQTLRGT